MANTYTQIYIHIIFAVSGRISLIREEFRETLQMYITGIVRGQRHKPYNIYCMPDHTHLLISLNPDKSLSDLVRDVKSGSSKFVNEQGLVRGRFQWQEGYAAFSYSHSHITRVCRYIENQRDHHARGKFTKELKGFLEKYQIQYQDDYIMKDIEMEPEI